MAVPSLVTILGVTDFDPIRVVDVGANPLDGSKGSYQGLLDVGLASVVGFAPDPEPLRQLQKNKRSGF